MFFQCPDCNDAMPVLLNRCRLSTRSVNQCPKDDLLLAREHGLHGCIQRRSVPPFSAKRHLSVRRTQWEARH